MLKTLTRKIEKDSLVVVLISVLILFSLFNIYSLNTINSAVRGEIEKAKPANIQLIEIVEPTCSDCDISSLKTQIESSSNVKVTDAKTLQFSSSEAKQLISQYSIKRIPVLIISGEMDKSNVVSLWDQLNGRKVDDKIIVESTPPYIDAQTNSMVGRVSVTRLIDSSCSYCLSTDNVVNSIKQFGVKITEDKTFEYTSDEAKILISKYGVKEVPVLIISKDIVEYESIMQVWSQLDVVEKDGFYVLHSNPPYRNLSSGKIEGLVSLVMLTDNSCSDCYDVTVHKQIVQGLGVKIVNESTYDINSTKGREFLSKYNITNVPTILVSPDTWVYADFTVIWKTVGTVESDGWYVFRKTEQMGKYRNV